MLLHLGGHPKALELLGGYLRGRPDRARTLLKNFGEAVETVDRRLATKRQERGRSLLVETVLAEVPEARLPAFDRLCLLEEPLPAEELESLLDADGIVDPVSDLAWLRGHGLLARKVAPSALSGGDSVHRLLASRRMNSLAKREGEKSARSWHLRVAEHFERREGLLSDFGIAARHRDVAGDRAGALDLYARWAVYLRDRNANVACIQIVQEGLEAFAPGDSEPEKVAASMLWNISYYSLTQLGKLKEVSVALENSLALLRDCSGSDARFHVAGTRMLRGRSLAGAGLPREAEAELDAALKLFTEGNHSKERAVTLGDIARLRAQAGDVPGALTLQEERLRIFEQLGEVRERAVALVDIARLWARVGDASGALKLLEEALRIHDQLGDVRDRAVVLNNIARLRARAGDVAGALELHEEELRTYEQLGDVRSRAVTLGDIARLRTQVGDVTEARRSYEEGLEVFRQLGYPDGIARTLFDLAQLDLREKKVENALPRLAESWELNNKIDRADGIAFVGQLYGALLAATNHPQARAVLQISREAFQRLGMDSKVSQIDGMIQQLQ